MSDGSSPPKRASKPDVRPSPQPSQERPKRPPNSASARFTSLPMPEVIRRRRKPSVVSPEAEEGS